VWTTDNNPYQTQPHEPSNTITKAPPCRNSNSHCLIDYINYKVTPKHILPDKSLDTSTHSKCKEKCFVWWLWLLLDLVVLFCFQAGLDGWEERSHHSHLWPITNLAPLKACSLLARCVGWLPHTRHCMHACFFALPDISAQPSLPPNQPAAGRQACPYEPSHEITWTRSSSLPLRALTQDHLDTELLSSLPK